MANDIRIIKKQLRAKYRKLREDINAPNKADYDDRIFNKIISLDVYKSCKTILCFVSTSIEVDTHRLINTALLDGKIVAVPKCVNLTGMMDFYQIKSLDELEISTFGLSEPITKLSKKMTDFDNSICILPGFAFDTDGYRIGFGKGYYDRFLNKYSGIKVGVCYNNCLTDMLPHGRYDVAADYIVTPKYTMTIKKGGQAIND